MPLLNGAFEFPRYVATKMPALRAFLGSFRFVCRITLCKGHAYRCPQSRRNCLRVGAQPWIKRILLENFPGPPRRILLTGIQIIEACPKTFGWFEPVFHFRRFRDGGGAPLKTVSMSTKRPASASAIPCLNDLGIQESSFSTTNLATCARSAGGNPLNSAMTSCALMLLINHKSSVRASHNPAFGV